MIRCSGILLASLLFVAMHSTAQTGPNKKNKAFDELDRIASGTKYLHPSTPEVPTLSMEEVKAKYPELKGLDDNAIVDVLHENFYRDMPRETIAAALNVAPRIVFVKRTLGKWDKWRFESCQDSAAKAPTPIGVTTGLRLCRGRFGQEP